MSIVVFSLVCGGIGVASSYLIARLPSPLFPRPVSRRLFRIVLAAIASPFAGAMVGCWVWLGMSNETFHSVPLVEIFAAFALNLAIASSGIVVLCNVIERLSPE